MKGLLIGRIGGTMLVISILLFTVGGGAALYLYYLQATTTELLVNNVVSVRAAEEFEIAILEVKHKLYEFLQTGNRSHLDAIDLLHDEADHWFHEADRTATTPQEQGWIALVKAGYARHRAEFDKLRSQPLSPDRVQRALDPTNDILTNQVLPPAHQYLDFNEGVIATTGSKMKQMTHRMALGLLMLGTCGSLAGLLAGFSMARRLTRSLVQLSVPVRDAAGKLSQVVGPMTVAAGSDIGQLASTMEDIVTHVGIVVEQLQESQREVLRADQLAAIGQLAAGMAHEVLNPLTAIKMLIEAADENNRTAPLSSRDIAVVREEITRVEALVQTFLDFGRPPKPNMQVVDANTLVEQTLSLVAGRANQQRVQIETQMPAAQVIVRVDPAQIRQVILNLLINALDSTDEGGSVSISVYVTRQTTDADLDTRRRTGSTSGASWFRLSVADTGSGLPSELGQRIFDPFVSTKDTGVGLGLSICSRIVAAHGGKITAANRPGSGAVFTVELPLSDESVVAG